MSVAQRLRTAQENLQQEFQAYQLALRHPRTPRLAKWLLALAIGYVLMPFDLIPDFIPVIGHLDDAVIVPALVLLALRLIPKKVIEECRRQVVDAPAVPGSGDLRSPPDLPPGGDQSNGLD